MSRPPILESLIRDERGVGLIELITVLAIVGTIIGATVTLFTSGMKSEIDLSQRVQAQEQARLALEIMRRDVHCASGVSGTVSSTSVTLNIAGACPSAGGAVQITWCTDTTGTRRKLYRVTGATCSDGVPTAWADYFVPPPAGSPTYPGFFAFTAQSTSSLARLVVDFPVDLDPSDTRRAYRLRDELVLRNSARQ